MRRILTFSILFLTLLSCSRGSSAIRTGDLLFCGWAEAMDDTTAAGAIAASVGPFVHVAILEAEGDSVWTIDATMRRGVSRNPLDTLLSDYAPVNGNRPILVVKRLKEGFREEFIRAAKSHLGEPYDYWFMPDNGRMYCSELVQECYRAPSGESLFGLQPMNFKDAEGAFPEYWVRLFSQLGEPIPQDMPGTNPQDMSQSPLLKYVTSF